jgi:putative chitinase
MHNDWYYNLKDVLPTNVFDDLGEVKKYGIDSPLRLCHFLSQCAHESGNFTKVTENLNYSWEALRSVFPRHFPTDEIAKEYHRQPERIANRAYANRMGNGDELSGDGWKFRGRGYIQLTGKSNYTQFNDYVDEDIIVNPDLVASKYKLESACFFWSINGLNRFAISATEDSIRNVTRAVNGGFNGLEDRINKFNLYWRSF